MAQTNGKLEASRRELRERAAAIKDAASTSLLSAAETLRREAGGVGNPEIAQQAEKLAQGMEKAAKYLSSKSVEQIADDVTSRVRENPLRSVGVAFFVGVVVGMILSRRD